MQGFCGLDSHSPGPHDANEPILARKCEREDVNPSRTLVAQMLSLSHSSPTLAPRAQQTFARSTRAPSGKLLPTAANRSQMPWQSTVTLKKPASVGFTKSARVGSSSCAGLWFQDEPAQRQEFEAAGQVSGRARLLPRHCTLRWVPSDENSSG